MFQDLCVSMKGQLTRQLRLCRQPVWPQLPCQVWLQEVRGHWVVPGLVHHQFLCEVMAQICQTTHGRVTRLTQTMLLCSTQLSTRLRRGRTSDRFIHIRRCRLVGAEYHLNGMMVGGTSILMSGTYTAITGKEPCEASLRPVLMDSSVAPFCVHFQMARPGIPWAGFLLRA